MQTQTLALFPTLYASHSHLSFKSFSHFDIGERIRKVENFQFNEEIETGNGKFVNILHWCHRCADLCAVWAEGMRVPVLIVITNLMTHCMIGVSDEAGSWRQIKLTWTLNFADILFVSLMIAGRVRTYLGN